jgi:hypothetical protein
MAAAGGAEAPGVPLSADPDLRTGEEYDVPINMTGSNIKDSNVFVNNKIDNICISQINI